MVHQKETNLLVKCTVQLPLEYQSKLTVIGRGTRMNEKWIRLSIIELLLTITGCWHACNNLLSPQAQCRNKINDSLYVLGSKGHDASPVVFTTPLNTITSTYHLDWKPFPDTPWHASAPVVLDNKCLLIIGGRNQFNNQIKTNEIFAFNSKNSLCVHR